MADAERATGLKATSGIELLTFSTPNGYKITALLEELRDAYGTDYAVQTVDITKNIQKEPWFTAINPNGRIPVLVDHDVSPPLAVFEGVAMLHYLARRFDRDHLFSFDPATEPADAATADSWMAWQHGGLGPMQGQANHFLHFARNNPAVQATDGAAYGVQRYVGEAERLYGVLDARLADRDFVAGPGRGRYSIADMAILGWAAMAGVCGADMARFTHVAAWTQRCLARPATARGFTVPISSLFLDINRAKRLADGGDEARKKEDEVLAYVAAAQKRFDYKYQCP